jgi:hypothetical protein
MKSALVLIVVAAVVGCAPQTARETPESRAALGAEQVRWWKGNLHTHSLWSDGNDFPEMIVDWYASRDYDFLAISDHNTLAEGEKWVPVPPGSTRERIHERYLERFGDDWVVDEPIGGDTLRVRLRTLAEYRPLFEKHGRFLLLQGEEISDQFGAKPLHVNATNLAEKVGPQGGNSVREVLQNNIDAVMEQRERTGRPMFPHVNHPNFVWAVTVEDLMALEGERFFEVYNGHPQVHNEGDHEHPSTERMWDILITTRLTEGREIMFGLATDDAHSYLEYSSTHSNPGRGWIMVRAPELTPEAIIASMEAGDFYSSSGVELRDVRREGERVIVEIAAEPGVTYTTQFIGTRRGYDRHSVPVVNAEGDTLSRRYSDEVGQVLAEVRGPVAEYRLSGDEIYVRARVVSSKVKENPYREGEVETAWTQPFF